MEVNKIKEMKFLINKKNIKRIVHKYYIKQTNKGT